MKTVIGTVYIVRARENWAAERRLRALSLRNHRLRLGLIENSGQDALFMVLVVLVLLHALSAATECDHDVVEGVILLDICAGELLLFSRCLFSIQSASAPHLYSPSSTLLFDPVAAPFSP